MLQSDCNEEIHQTWKYKIIMNRRKAKHAPGRPSLLKMKTYNALIMQ